jgi:hypothetical protein
VRLRAKWNANSAVNPTSSDGNNGRNDDVEVQKHELAPTSKSCVKFISLCRDIYHLSRIEDFSFNIFDTKLLNIILNHKYDRLRLTKQENEIRQRKVIRCRKTTQDMESH